MILVGALLYAAAFVVIVAVCAGYIVREYRPDYRKRRPPRAYRRQKRRRR